MTAKKFTLSIVAKRCTVDERGPPVDSDGFPSFKLPQDFADAHQQFYSMLPTCPFCADWISVINRCNYQLHSWFRSRKTQRHSNSTSKFSREQQ
jgi:hypothetical protein